MYSHNAFLSEFRQWRQIHKYATKSHCAPPHEFSLKPRSNRSSVEIYMDRALLVMQYTVQLKGELYLPGDLFPVTPEQVTYYVLYVYIKLYRFALWEGVNFNMRVMSKTSLLSYLPS